MFDLLLLSSCHLLQFGQREIHWETTDSKLERTMNEKRRSEKAAERSCCLLTPFPFDCCCCCCCCCWGCLLLFISCGDEWTVLRVGERIVVRRRWWWWLSQKRGEQEQGERTYDDVDDDTRVKHFLRIFLSLSRSLSRSSPSSIDINATARTFDHDHCNRQRRKRRKEQQMRCSTYKKRTPWLDGKKKRTARRERNVYFSFRSYAENIVD